MRAPVISWALGAALATLPHLAAACTNLSETVWLCDRESAWEAAEWDPYGDGTTLLLDDFALDFSQDYPGADILDATTTLEEQMTTYVAYQEAETAPELLRDEEEIETPYANARLRHQKLALEDVVYQQTVVLAEVGRSRVMLWLSAPEDTPPENMDTAAAEIVSMLRDSCADPVSCAEGYVPQRALDDDTPALAQDKEIEADE